MTRLKLPGSLAVGALALAATLPVGGAGATLAAANLPPLATPTNLTPFVAPSMAGEGVFRPVGRPIDGHAAVYVTSLRPLDNPQTVAGVAWMDTNLLHAELYSGSLSPGGYSWHRTAPIPRPAAKTLVAAFNGGFLLKDSHGGYYSEGRLVAPLVAGAASLVIYKDGRATVGAWGRDVSMSAQVAAVRQNLTLLVDNGVPAPGLVSTDINKWGYSLNNQIDTPRSALGVTADGALVYAEGEMNIVDLARTMVRAGAVRAMVLDMNPLWPVYAYYTPASPTGFASAGNGRVLTPTMIQTPARFFQPAYSRDFITMSGL